MALRKILTQGDPSLEKACRPVEKFDRKLHWLLDDLKETLENAGGWRLRRSAYSAAR